MAYKLEPSTVQTAVAYGFWAVWSSCNQLGVRVYLKLHGPGRALLDAGSCALHWQASIAINID